MPEPGKRVAEKGPSVDYVTRFECGARHTTGNWFVTIGVSILVAAMGFLYKKIDTIQSDVTSVRIAVQHLTDQITPHLPTRIADDRDY